MAISANGEIVMQQVTVAERLTAVRCKLTTGARRRPTILCVHGMMAGAWQFERLQPFLAKLGYTSLAINLRGHYGSQPVNNLESASVSDYVEDALLTAQFLGRPIAIGQSMGGLITQKLAEQDAISAAVFACSLPPGDIPWEGATWSVAELRQASLSLCGQVEAPERAEFDDLVYNRIPEDLRPELFAKQVPESGRVVADCAQGTISVDQQRVRCPNLSIVAGDDRLVLPEVGLSIAKKYDGTAIYMPSRGHYALIAEAGWQSLATIVAAWLADVVQ